LQGAERMGEGNPVDQNGDDRIDERQCADQRRGIFWMALYSRVDMSPVWTTPMMIRYVQAPSTVSTLLKSTNGARTSTPTTIWISTIRCAGKSLRRLVIAAATA
jgi:hypothetical protein